MSGLLVLISSATSIAAAPVDPVQVAPGSLVRWGGEGVESCGLQGRTWPAIDQTCWYPIDLLLPPGNLELARWQHDELQRVTVRIGAYPYEIQHITLQNESQVTLSAEDLRRVEKENRQIAALWGLQTPRRFDLPLTAPLSPLPAGGRFGARRFFNDQPRSPHSGADFAAAAGTPVLAAAAGQVALVGDFFFSGKSVFLDHGDGLITMYFHLREIRVAAGGEVEPGQVLGVVGQTGRATGPHLHFGVRWHRARIDPAWLLAPETARRVAE
jgi:murein DD-endopeptidase MepM/ murein hydrolase activator NlpD